jgi:hypothetical protein
VCERCEENRENFVLLVAAHNFLRGRDLAAEEVASASAAADAKKEAVRQEKQKNLDEFRAWQDHLKCRK